MHITLVDAANEDNLMHITFVDAAVLHAFLHWTHGVAEVIHVEFLEARTGKRARVVNTVEKRINLNGGLGGRGQCALCTLALCPQPTNGTVVSSKILAPVLALEVLHAKIHNAVVKVLATKVRVASSGLHLKDSILDGKQRHVEGAATHVVDEDVLFAAPLLVQAISDGRRRWLINNAEDVHTRDRSSIL